MTGTSHPDNDELRAAVAALVDMFGGHAGHTLSQVGPCVYCDDCDIRLYQGTLPDKKRVPAPAKERHDRWFKHAMDLAAEVSRLRAEVDTLRADQALDQEGHQRVCVPIEAERDTLRETVLEIANEMHRATPNGATPAQLDDWQDRLRAPLPSHMQDDWTFPG